MKALPDKISLVMRSYNEAWALGDTLKGIYSQDYEGQIELIVIDSGSTDGSHAIIQQYNPAHFIILEPGTYVPGKVLNQGLRLSSNDWVVFLNSDATPADKKWLSELLEVAVNCPTPGTVFSRQIPRNNCKAVFAHDYDRCFGPNRESVHWDHFFSMVSCVVHRPTWKHHPFREDLQYAEDDEWSRRLKKNGRTVAYAGNSIAIHSHNYTPAESRKRARGDAVAVAQAGNVPDVRRYWHRDVLLGTLKDVKKDVPYLLRNGKLSELCSAVKVRYSQRLGRLEGYREGLKRLREKGRRPLQ